MKQETKMGKLALILFMYLLVFPYRYDRFENILKTIKN